MLTITYRHPEVGRASKRADLDAAAFHESALSSGLAVATAADGTTIRVTRDSRELADFSIDTRASVSSLWW
jgi:hypothetical protein